MDSSMRDNSGTYQPWSEKNANTKEEVEDSSPKFTLEGTFKVMLFTGPLNILLFCTPIGIISYIADWPGGLTFTFSLLALAPLAERLGFVTEQLALHTNETIGGLLNATFGNATELIVAISALSRGMYKLVQLSLLGSILSNLLLVLGCSFLFGGYYNKTQHFGTISSQINSTLLMLATMGILFPTILSHTNEESELGEIGYSRATSLILFLTYFAFLYFQLFSHRHVYEERPPSPPKVLSSTYSPNAALLNSNTPASNATGTVGNSPTAIVNAPLTTTTTGDIEGNISSPSDDHHDEDDHKSSDEHHLSEHGDDDDEEEEDLLGFYYALVWLAAITVLIAVLSEAISDSISDAADSGGISGVFLSAIALPIVGNAAEHAGSVMFAVKGKLDLSLGVAIGSSTQIALCVLPLLVLFGWMGGMKLSLNFGGFEAASLFLSVVSVTFAIKDGVSNWLTGLTLIAMYFVIAVGFWAHHDDDLSNKS